MVQCRYPTYKATDCPDVNGGRPGISEGDFGGVDDRWLAKMLSHGLVSGSCCDVSSVRASKR